MRAPYAGITFLSYEDLEAGDRFYREVLGLPLVEDQGWAKVYRIHGSSHVGIVKSARSHGTRPPDAGVLLSIVVEDVDTWYDRLKDEPSVEILAPPSMVADIPVYSFFLKDPGGHPVEIQAFTDGCTQRRFGHVSGQIRNPLKECPCQSIDPSRVRRDE
jgi:catechol 2,3-dioxygenase-like lactoylglutathione lyase family enzyme